VIMAERLGPCGGRADALELLVDVVRVEQAGIDPIDTSRSVAVKSDKAL
jgi:hypothetical protein